MNHKLRVLFYVLLAVMLALIATGEQNSLAKATIFYVDADASGAHNGRSWVKAYYNLQDALDAAAAGDQIWVAAGIYIPTLELIPGDPRSACFQMKNGVAIYGGFDPSVGDIAWEDRDWANNVTILSGDLYGDDGPDFTNTSENSYHVFYHPAEAALDSSAILDGFTVTGGIASGQSPHIYGGGIYNQGSSPTLTNCTLSDNYAADGGGMYNWNGSSPTLTNCTFTDNFAYWGGGGMYNITSASPVLTGCTFRGNSSGSGGGIFNDFSAPRLTNCTFWGNAANYGGGVYNINSASPALTNCTFSGNSAVNYGGGIYSYYNSSPSLTNSILWGDTSPEINSDYASTTVVTFSDVQGGYSGAGNIAADPLFVDAASGDFHLGRGSPAIDTGNNSASYLPLYDFEGDVRIHDGDFDGIATVDMGVDETAYEAPPMTLYYVDQDATGENNGTSWVDAFTTLQPALDAAISGDQIWVASGTYLPTHEFTPGDPRSVSFQMKNGVVIYGGFAGFESSLDQRNWVTNITILSGDLNGDDGPDFTNNSENSYHVFYHPSGTALNSNAILDGFTVSGGASNTSGGGMYNDGSSPTLSNVIFSNNSAYYEGGGMLNINSSPLLTNCLFSLNLAMGGGGGMFNGNSSPKLTNCTFSGNSAVSYGGGMYNTDMLTSPVLINCFFFGNSADKGGGIANRAYVSTKLTNCTFVGNIANYGGGMYSEWSSLVRVTNSILWGDSPEEIYDADIYYDPEVTYSDIQGGYFGTGNINADPIFADSADNDFHLAKGSPCIDTGNNAAADLPPYDIDGDARILDGNHDGTATVDMGMDEFDAPPPVVLFVNQDATGANDGTSWADAFTTLQPALDAVWGGDQVWVAEGTYIPTKEFSPGDPRSVSFQMKNGVAIYGGFAGTESSLDQRDWVTNITILSGDVNGDDGLDFANNAENSYHVFYQPEGIALNSSAILDGFTIAAGNANGTYPHNQGGGMLNISSHPALANCTFSNNAALYGGGMFNRVSNPTITECIFTGNSASVDGGGMYNYWSTPALTNFTFEGNFAGEHGGGISNQNYAAPVLTNGTLANNTALYGGGIHNSDADPTVSDCTFSNNTASYGGGMYNGSSDPRLTNCTFLANIATIHGGGIYNYYFSNPWITNCTFSGNSAAIDGGGMYNSGISSPSLTDCTFSGNSAVEGNGGGMLNIYSSPRLTNSTFSGNLAGSLGGGMYNRDRSSPVVTNCVIRGNSAESGGGMYNIESSNPKLINTGFLGNSAELGGAMYNNATTPEITNCTFYGNTANIAGGGMYNIAYPAPIVANSILWGDTPDEISADPAASPIVTYSDVQGGFEGEGNIDADPLFVDPTSDDFHLTPNSPAIDAGSNAAPDLPLYDFDGDTRILDGNGDEIAIVDMGVDEVVNVAPVILEVSIDIKPSTLQNNIRLTSRGTLPVAILTSGEFDAATVDPDTVLFAGAAPVQLTMEDIDLDGDLDLLLYFQILELILDETSTEATLTGATFDGTLIQGTDTVNIIP